MAITFTYTHFCSLLFINVSKLTKRWFNSPQTLTRMKHKTAILELVAILIISAICVYIVCNDLTIIEQIPIWLMVSLIQQLIWYYLNKRT